MSKHYYRRFEEQRKKLEETHKWPTVYMFKFIIPAENKKIAQVRAMFEETADISLKESKKGNYISITVKELMFKPENILHVYQRSARIEGLIAL